MSPAPPKKRSRQERHLHNRFFGYVQMDKAHMQAIIQSSTAGPFAKRYADEILNKLYLLGEELKERVET